jgi:hypothetical protein
LDASALRIVHVFRAPLGGLFRHVVDLCVEQASRGHQVGLFFDQGGDEPRVRAAGNAGDRSAHRPLFV